MSEPNLAIESLSDGSLVQLTGEIDLSVSPSVKQQLLKVLTGKPSRLIVDLTDVSYMDSSGVATLVEALQHQRRAGAKMILCGLQPRVRGIFEVSRLDTIFTIVDDLEAAKTA